MSEKKFKALQALMDVVKKYSFDKHGKVRRHTLFYGDLLLAEKIEQIKDGRISQQYTITNHGECLLPFDLLGT